MIKKWQEIYPSSNVPATVIADYGWRLFEDLPARVTSAGNLAPVPEASQYLRELRSVIDDTDTLTLAGEKQAVEIQDFAVAAHPHGVEQALGFFILLPRE